jgi:hypothetical protein
VVVLAIQVVYDARLVLSHSVAWRPSRRFAAGVLLAALSLFATPVGRGVADSRPRVETLASFAGTPYGFAQARDEIVWLSADSKCNQQVTFRDLRTGASSSVPAEKAITVGESNRDRCAAPTGMALAGGWAYWTSTFVSNSALFAALRIAAPGDHRYRNPQDGQSVNRPPAAPLLGPVSDGRSAYFISSPDDGTPGPLVRWTGTSSKAMTGTLQVVWALAGGDGVHAYAASVHDCALDPSWSPDGRLIAYVEHNAGTVPGRRCEKGLWVMNADGSAAHLISPTGGSPSWSPDGTKLAYTSGDAIVVASVTGAGARAVAHGGEPVWSPDGTRLAFSRDTSIYVANADGSGERLLVAGGGSPSWSPDGSRIVFARPIPETDFHGPPSVSDKQIPVGITPGLAIVNADGSGLTPLTRGDDYDPVWSPSGRWIAYSTFDGESSSDNASLQIVSPDGKPGPAVHSTDDFTTEQGISWAPDSIGLVFAAADNSGALDGDSHLETGAITNSGRIGVLTRSPPPRVVVSRPTGAVIGRYQTTGTVLALAADRQAAAVLTQSGNALSIDVLAPRERVVRLPNPPNAVTGELSISGTTLVFCRGPSIYTVDVRGGTPKFVASANGTPVGLSINGRRIAWAEPIHGTEGAAGTGGRVRAVTLG